MGERNLCWSGKKRESLPGRTLHFLFDCWFNCPLKRLTFFPFTKFSGVVFRQKESGKTSPSTGRSSVWDRPCWWRSQCPRYWYWPQHYQSKPLVLNADTSFSADRWIGISSKNDQKMKFSGRGVGHCPIRSLSRDLQNTGPKSSMLWSGASSETPFFPYFIFCQFIWSLINQIKLQRSQYCPKTKWK